MSEREYRNQIASLLSDLDRAARAVGRGAKKAFVPAALGVGLLLANGGCAYGDEGPGPVDKGVVAEMGPLYMSPDLAQPDTTPPAIDGPPAPAYMSPDSN